jgi:hypothetical protein
MRASLLKTIVLAVLAVSSFSASAQQAAVKLRVEILPFSSEIELKEKVKKQLESGGLEWGAKDGQLVFTMVNKRFINFDLPNFTRYGTDTSIELPAGEYVVTGIGLIPSTAFSPEKILAKGAYFNEKVMTFNVEEGKTTTVKVKPVIRKNATFFLNYFMPELLVSIAPEGGEFGSEVSVIAKTESSVPWPAYNGPLKFQAAK